MPRSPARKRPEGPPVIVAPVYERGAIDFAHDIALVLEQRGNRVIEMKLSETPVNFKRNWPCSMVIVGGKSELTYGKELRNAIDEISKPLKAVSDRLRFNNTDAKPIGIVNIRPLTNSRIGTTVASESAEAAATEIQTWLEQQKALQAGGIDAR